jgi:hypothetical protein
MNQDDTPVKYIIRNRAPLIPHAVGERGTNAADEPRVEARVPERYANVAL